MRHTIEIKINPEDGTIETEVSGIEGPSCEAVSAWLNSLGEVLEDRHTDDFDKRRKIKKGGKVTN